MKKYLWVSLIFFLFTTNAVAPPADIYPIDYTYPDMNSSEVNSNNTVSSS
jgi:hypothetical protein